MAENDDGQERSEEPTAKRLREAREKGQVPRSRELASMTMLMAASVGLLVMGQGMASHLEGLLIRGFSLERTLAFDKHAAMAFVTSAIGAIPSTLSTLPCLV